MTSTEVRDAVHGLVELTPREWKVVDSPAFQRLRGVQQLALTHLVYPGARHSRFEHCLGACHLAERLADRLGLDHEDRQRVRTAALLHDVGHGPFSRVGESVFEQLTGQQHVHERITAAIIRFHGPIQSAIDSDAEWVAQLLEGDGRGALQSAARDIVSGPVDVDKMDYLLRDSHYCGVNYGRFDIDKLIESARLVETPDGQHVAFHEDGIFAVEDLMLARYHMHRQVYGHKTRIAADEMLVRGILFGVEEGLLPRHIFAPEVLNASYVEEYLEWDDHRTLAALSAGDDSRAGAMIRALTGRRLMKRVVKLSFGDLVSGERDEISAERALAPSSAVVQREQRRAERLVAEAIGVDPMWVAFHWDASQLPRTEVPITNGCGSSLKKFSEMSEVFRRYEAVRPTTAVSVYIRPTSDAGEFSSADQSAVREAAISALHQIGRSQ